ncbi:hypothetical protein RD1_4130 [Roseobacter denitrificans OCh 114]|uniref:Uncharacterized protein n=1 Tax=Roseobacter denitrificans (strain ATCC 33942 / OCh 114) TaxID=375451 RepID=Q160M3_ROSDO|nr:hypothetical protein RD1_4130 [Roseobacter denitrificans OCh 114]
MHNGHSLCDARGLAAVTTLFLPVVCVLAGLHVAQVLQDAQASDEAVGEFFIEGRKTCDFLL